MNRIMCSACALLLVGSSVPGDANGQTKHGWPIHPVDEDHPLGATLGEFQQRGAKVYQHTGIDILAPACDGPEPCVFVTVGGIAFSCTDEAGTLWNAAQITATNPKRTYVYSHLKHQTYDANFKSACTDPLKNTFVSKGSPIAAVAPWTCDYKHLHYGVAEGLESPQTSKYLNPLQGFAPGMDPDPDPPEIFGIGLANQDAPRWTEFSSNGLACTVVKGKVDIVVHLLDRDDAGSTAPGATNTGVYKLRWRACPEGAPNCPWNDPHVFDEMSYDWDDFGPNTHTPEEFSTTSPWISDFDECSATVNETFMVATSSPSASWDTTTLSDGSYTVSVEASDYAQNKTTKTVQVCVQNRPRPNPPTNVDPQ